MLVSNYALGFLDSKKLGSRLRFIRSSINSGYSLPDQFNVLRNLSKTHPCSLLLHGFALQASLMYEQDDVPIYFDKCIHILRNGASPLLTIPSSLINDICSSLLLVDPHSVYLIPTAILKQSKEWEIPEYSINQIPVYSGSNEFERFQFLCRPPRTGFFSYVEHIILCSFFAFESSLSLQVITDNWPYSREGLLCLPNEVAGFKLKFSDSPATFRSSNYIDLTRERILPWLLINGKRRKDFSRFKNIFYNLFYQQSKEMLLAYGCHSPKPNKYTVIFLRGGDKLNTESLSPNIKEFAISYKQWDRSIVCSDDVRLLNALQKNNCLVRVLDGYNISPSGAHLEVESGGIASVLDILHKFIILMEARDVIGCPGSNLINSAIFSNHKKLKMHRSISTLSPKIML